MFLHNIAAAAAAAAVKESGHKLHTSVDLLFQGRTQKHMTHWKPLSAKRVTSNKNQTQQQQKPDRNRPKAFWFFFSAASMKREAADRHGAEPRIRQRNRVKRP